MSVVNLTPTVIARTGIDILPGGANMAAAAVDGNSFVNTGSQFLVVNNTDIALTVGVTLVCQQTVDGKSVTSRTVTVAPLGEKIIGPFPIASYNDANSKVQITYDQVVNVKVGVFSFNA